MTRIVIIALVAAVLAGCASDRRQGRRGTPPQDPPDYQGVPTDMTPSMLGEPGTGGTAATPAK